GIGAGGEIVGLAIGGAGVGAGDRIHGLAIGGLGVGSPRIEGVAIGAYVRATDVRGVIIAPVLFRSFREADVHGGVVAPVVITNGLQRGLAIGIVNYAHALDGVQVGLVNYVRDNPAGRRVLPVVNWGRGR
ncbi:MAG: hypothetical protein K1X31_11290, partial [Gemmatimonadaceae bacterium]|nr:hypothetical protein [Gemmatimonadaceae bacterium]